MGSVGALTFFVAVSGFGAFLALVLGSRIEKCGSGINIPDHIFRELMTNFFGLKIGAHWGRLHYLLRIRDPVPFLPWIRDGKIRIQDKHPGSATLILIYILVGNVTLKTLRFLACTVPVFFIFYFILFSAVR
jgi:hypothetical protein